MSTAEESHDPVARVYAQAILELAEAEGQAEGLLEELRGFEQTVAANPALTQFLSAGDVDAARRAAMIEKTIRGRASDLLVNALQVINRKGRLGSIGAIIDAYRLALEALRSRVDVEVTTAVPLSDDLRAALAGVASRYTGREAQLIERVDERLLGGLTLRIGDTKLDSSLASHLVRMRQSLEQRGERAIHGDLEWQFVEGRPG